jgi:hypothetical protein
MAAFVTSTAGLAFSEERTPGKVKNSEVVTGVVIVPVQKGARSLELQRNQGAGTCKALPSGNYLMAGLFPNFGVQDCKNGVRDRGDPGKPEAAQKTGEYCLVA